MMLTITYVLFYYVYQHIYRWVQYEGCWLQVQKVKVLPRFLSQLCEVGHGHLARGSNEWNQDYFLNPGGSEIINHTACIPLYLAKINKIIWMIMKWFEFHIQNSWSGRTQMEVHDQQRMYVNVMMLRNRMLDMRWCYAYLSIVHLGWTLPCMMSLQGRFNNG